MATKERYQNPVVGDDVRLRLFSFNSNNLFDVTVQSVAIYYLDRQGVNESNPDGRTLVTILTPDQVVREDTGTYLVDLPLPDPTFVLGRYLDVWTYTADPNQPDLTVENTFRVYPQLFYSTPIPVVYDFGFTFQPNRLRKGSRQYLRIMIQPNVPRATDLQRYYENLAITSNLKVSIAQKCGPCVPTEVDLRTVVDEDQVDYRECAYGYYQLDTEDLDLGVYDVWFTLEIGGNRYVSDKQTLQIYD